MALLSSDHGRALLGKECSTRIAVDEMIVSDSLMHGGYFGRRLMLISTLMRADELAIMA